MFIQLLFQHRKWNSHICRKSQLCFARKFIYLADQTLTLPICMTFTFPKYNGSIIFAKISDRPDYKYCFDPFFSFLLGCQFSQYWTQNDTQLFCQRNLTLFHFVYYFVVWGRSQTTFTRRGRQLVQKCHFLSTFTSLKMSRQRGRWSKKAKILSSQFVSYPLD